MVRIKFAELVQIYRNTVFDAEGGTGILTIENEKILSILRLLEEDDDAAGEANVMLLDDIEAAQVGSVVQVRIRPPRLGIGVFARTVQAFLDAPNVRLKEPADYYIVDLGFASSDLVVPEEIVKYRKMLSLVGLISEAASYLDIVRSEIVFVRDNKFIIPVNYGVDNVDGAVIKNIDKILEKFSSDIHRDQKLEILADAVVNLCGFQPLAERFSFLVANLGEVVREVRDGYRLFASNFSYSKIRSELENARIEYATKIHRTIVDIQSQLLGIPVATIIVASQMKPAPTCGSELWGNIAVLFGAWIFVVLLFVSIINQWLTLRVLQNEINRQKNKLSKDYAAISEQFSDIFSSLDSRIGWHRFALRAVAAIGLVGALCATFAFDRLVNVDIAGCVKSGVPVSLGSSFGDVITFV